MPQQEIQTYTRLKRKQHSGGRPAGCAGNGGRTKLTTTLTVEYKKHLQDLAKQYGTTQGTIIELMIHAHFKGTTLDEVVRLYAPGGHFEDLELLNQALSGAFKGLEIVE